jgi:conjugative relaxase-like TrwC/TraI family protein
MLTMKAQYSLGNAEKYFKEHLRVGDYYMAGRNTMGQWIGKGAEELGLRGETATDDFVNLCRNLNPQTGERLTQRLNSKRAGDAGEVANRRVFYDFTLSPPKSVSIAALVGDDQRIIDAHDEAIQSALRQLEFYAASRVRKDRQTSHRVTGNLVGAVFRHDTSRALDPHLHTHCILFNATKDSVENRWKALEPCEMLRAQKFVEQAYYHELARSLNRFGYRLRNKPRGDFEIEGVSPELTERFSKRHREIDEKTRELLEREPEKAGQNLNEIRANIAHKERARKIRDIGLTKLQSIWNAQLSSDERREIGALAQRPSPPAQAITAEQAVAWAEEHLFARRSVVHEHELWRHALEHARGQNVELPEIQAVTLQRGYVRDKDFQDRITTREVITREWNIVCMAEAGIGKHKRFAPTGAVGNPLLDTEQQRAVEHILSSRDFVTLFRGGAGTGKSFTLREVQAALKQSGHTVQVLAPQRQQVNDLARDGLGDAQTVSAFLAQRSMSSSAVVLVDEAGQIGGEQMLQLLRLAKEHDGRVILSGDTRQHGAVEASDALRAIEKYSGLQYAELTNIRRQNPNTAKDETERHWLMEYKQAVNEAQAGQLAQSFDRLEKQNAIVSCTLADQQEKLTEHFLGLAGQSTVIVSQSWAEIHKLNERVRQELRRRKLIGESETVVTALERRDLTDAQKRDKRFYDSDSVLAFNRDASGFKAGESGRLLAVTKKDLLIQVGDRIRPVSFRHLDKLTVCQPKELALSGGDRLQLKANGQAKDGRKLANGELVTVKDVHSDGRIALSDGRMLEKDYRQFVRGYAVTSYAAQGKTVDYVLFSDSAVKAATNAQQWYVTISRGRKGVRIFTADKFQLRENIARSEDRTLALDIAKPKKNLIQRLAVLWRRGLAFALNAQHSERVAIQRRAESQAIQKIAGIEQTETVSSYTTVRQQKTGYAKKIVISQPPPQNRSRGIGI